MYFWRNSDKRFPCFNRQHKWPKLYRDDESIGVFTFTLRENWINQNEDEWCHYVWSKCQLVMLYSAWDREINILLFFCDVFVWKWGPRPRTSSCCYHGNKSAATFIKGIFVHPPWAPNCMQNLKGGWKFSFPKMFDSYRLVINNLFKIRWPQHTNVLEESKIQIDELNKMII